MRSSQLYALTLAIGLFAGAASAFAQTQQPSGAAPAASAASQPSKAPQPMEKAASQPTAKKPAKAGAQAGPEPKAGDTPPKPAKP